MNEIINFYRETEEKNRLATGVNQLEFERTKIVIEKYLHATNLDIVDIGGASGPYSFWLAAKGHKVTLVDLTAKHLEQAKEFSETNNIPLKQIITADARELSMLPGEQFDVVLLMGPLYHLVDSSDRLKAINESKRILRKNGFMICAGINRYASLFDGMMRGFVHDDQFFAILKEDLVSGQHRNPSDNKDYFTTALFQTPFEMQSELMAAGLQIVETIAVEGAAWLIPDFEERWRDELKKKRILDVLALTEHNEDLLAVTSHYLVVAKDKHE